MVFFNSSNIPSNLTTTFNSTSISNQHLSIFNNQNVIQKHNSFSNDNINVKVNGISQKIFSGESFHTKSQVSEDDAFLSENFENILDENMLQSPKDDITFIISQNNNDSHKPNVSNITSPSLNSPITGKINNNLSGTDSTLLNAINTFATNGKSKLKSSPVFFNVEAKDVLSFLNNITVADSTNKEAIDTFKSEIDIGEKISIFFNSNRLVMNSPSHKNVFMSKSNENKEETLKLEKLGYKIHYINDDAFDFLISVLKTCKDYLEKKDLEEKKEKATNKRLPNNQALPIDANLKTKNKREKNEKIDEDNSATYKTLDLTIEIAEEEVRINNEKKKKAWEKRIEDGLVQDIHDHDQNKTEHRINDQREKVHSENIQQNQDSQNLREKEK